MSTSEKLSQFTAKTTLNDGDLVPVTSGGQNFNITWANLKLDLGTTGTLSAAGAALSTPILGGSGTSYKIRSIESGAGILASVSAEDGVSLKLNLTHDTTGETLFNNTNDAKPDVCSLVGGTGITLTKSGNVITISLT